MTRTYPYSPSLREKTLRAAKAAVAALASTGAPTGRSQRLMDAATLAASVRASRRSEQPGGEQEVPEFWRPVVNRGAEAVAGAVAAGAGGGGRGGVAVAAAAPVLASSRTSQLLRRADRATSRVEDIVGGGSSSGGEGGAGGGRERARQGLLLDPGGGPPAKARQSLRGLFYDTHGGARVGDGEGEGGWEAAVLAPSDDFIERVYDLTRLRQAYDATAR